MKKLVILSSFLILFSITNSQNSINKLNYTLFNETTIGTTWYDLQSNSALSNRIHYFPDGTISAVWTMGFQPTAFPERGTGYNYFDGSTWDSQPTQRIETDRCGWPSIAPWGNNGEIVVSHIKNMSDNGLLFNKRINKGQGEWEELQWQGPPGNEKVMWPRIMTSGENNEFIHMLCFVYNIYLGQDYALLYNRSTDGGETWDIQWEIPEGMGIDNYLGFNSDNSVWAQSCDSIIAFAVASPWYDMFIMKSTDNGLNWEKIMVWEHPYPFFDFASTCMTDTLWAPDKSVDIAIDINGKVHLVCGLTRVVHFEPGVLNPYYIPSDGIAYWNEDMPPFESANQHDALDPVDILIEDYNLIGWQQDINGNGTIDLTEYIHTYRSWGLSTMPSLSIDDNNNIFMAFSSTTEGYVNGYFNYKHIWLRGYSAESETWGEFLDIDSYLSNDSAEYIYPVIAGSSDDKIHLIYNIDDTPGLALDSDQPYNENYITYITVEKTAILSGVSVNSFDLSDKFKIYPNPTSDKVVIETNLIDPTNMKLFVYNSLGRIIEIIDFVGDKSNTTSINLAKYGNGIYYLKLELDEGSFIQKICVVK